MNNKNIVDRVRMLANAQGMSLPVLETKLNLGNGTISRWSKSSPNSDKLMRVADFFHVPVDYLLGREPSSYDSEYGRALQQERSPINVSYRGKFPEPKLSAEDIAALHCVMSDSKFNLTQYISQLEMALRSLPENIQPMPRMKEWKVLGGTACGDPLYKDLGDETILAPDDIDADYVFRCVGDSMINARIFDGDIVFVKTDVSVDDGQIAVVRIDEEYTLKRIFHGPDYLELRSENPTHPTRIIRGEQVNAEIVGRAVYFLSRVV